MSYTFYQATASSKQQQQAAAGAPKVLATTPWLKTGIQVAQNDRGAKAHHHKQGLCRFEPSIPFYGRFSLQKWPFLRRFKDDRPQKLRTFVGLSSRCFQSALLFLHKD